MKSTFHGLLGILFALSCAAADSRVRFERVPQGGVQPRALVSGDGTIHLVYLHGPERESDVSYVRRAAGAKSFSAPLRVNSQPGSAVAVGTIRGAQLALGRAGRVHVAWNGGPAAQPRTGEHSGPMLYARLNDAGDAFEAQRNLMTKTSALDGGGTVVADGAGNVFVVWHAAEGAPGRGEAGRAVFLAASADDGVSYAPERRVNARPTGACGCCGLQAFADAKGNLWTLYRGAERAINRDMLLLFSADGGRNFESQLLDRMRSGKCPMSSSSFRERDGRVLIAWETSGPVRAGVFDATAKRGLMMEPTRGGSPGKHPVAVANAAGEVLLTWVEGSAWKKGGRLAWQIFDAQGRPRGGVESGPQLSVWSKPDVVVEADGDFVVFH